MSEGRPPVVLLVDDEPLNSSAFARSFRRDLDVRTANSGAAALEALEQGGVEVLVTDYRMPGMDGLELLTQVARRWPSLPCLLVSGQDADELHDAVSAGLAAAVLLKPWDRTQVLSLVRTLVSRAGK